jgi:hypothetical protein
MSVEDLYLFLSRFPKGGYLYYEKKNGEAVARKMRVR